MSRERDILLEFDNLRIDAGGESGKSVSIVKGISFTVERGNVVALIGESGSGKTTIGLSVMGYTKPGLRFAGGRVLLEGEDILRMDPLSLRDLRGKRVAYLAQSAAATFNPAIKIGKQVTESAVLHGVLSRDEANERAIRLYRALELPEPDRIGNRYPHQVSGGQLQRLMAAMALLGKPDLLVLDEPTTALDVTTQIEVLQAFKKVIREERAAAIYISHDLSVVAQIANYIIVVYGGEIMEMGTVDQIINDPKHGYTRRLMSAVRPPPTAESGLAARDDQTRDVPTLTTRKIVAGYGKKADGNLAIEVLSDIDLTVEHGHAVGVIGESGCGKSTLARVVAGLTPSRSGQVLLDGVELPRTVSERHRADLRKVQLISQMADTALNPKQRIDEILGRPVELFLGLKGSEKRKKVTELLKLVELPAEFAERYPEELSGGQKQRINLARGLAADPEVLLCDEVISSLDSIVGDNIIRLLKDLRKKLGVSFVFISHDLSTVASFADAIVVLYAGRVAEKGPVHKVLSPPFHPYTRLLVASVPQMRVGWMEEVMESRTAQAGIARVVTFSKEGCPFFARCSLGIPNTCDHVVPPERDCGDNHFIYCHREISFLSEDGLDRRQQMKADRIALA